MTETGFFKDADLHTIVAFKNDLRAAKEWCCGKIDDFVLDHPLTKTANIEKANAMITRAKSVSDLAISVSNFVLAHTSENLKVIK